MVDVPTEVPYGQVVGHFVRFVADTADDAAVPDELPLQGSVTLTPLTKIIRYPTTDPPRMAVAETVACTLDPAGDLQCVDGTPVSVIATNQPAGQPSLVQWQATFRFTNVAVQPAPLVFNVPANGVVDLSVLVGVPPEPPAIIVVDPDSAMEAAQAADDAQAAADDAAQAAADAAAAAAQASADAANTVKVTTQTFTTGQQTQARTNISSVGKGELILNVKDYGAKGDGTTNDTAAVQAAINAANTAGGAEVFFPNGTYNVQTALTLYSKVTLRGVRGRSTLLIGGTQTSAIAVVSRISPSITDLIIDGNASATINQLLFVSGGSGLTVARCRFTNVATANAYGILLSTAAADVQITDSEFSAMQRGVGMTTACARVTIKDNRFVSLGGYGTYGVSSAGSVLADILIQGNHYSAIGVAGTVGRQPLYFTGGAVGVYADRVRIVNNVIIGNSTHYNGGTGNGDLIAAYGLSDSEIANNTVLYGGDVGIAVWRSRRTTVTGNVTGRNNTNGICLMESFSCTVTGNVVWSNRADYGAEFAAIVKGGIRALLSSTGNTITGNRCFNETATPTQDYGLVFEVGSDNNVAIGNLLEGNAVGAVSDLAIGNQIGRRLLTRTASYTLTTADDVVSINAASATATLPTAVGNPGRRYVIKNLHSTSLTVATTSGQTIDGAAPTPLAQWAALTVMSTGTNWIKL